MLTTHYHLDTYPRGRWRYNTLIKKPIVDNFTHCRLQLELISTSDVTWIPYTAEYLTEGFMDEFLAWLKFALLTRRVPLLTYGGWKLYLGERAFHYVTGEICIPFHPPSRRFWPVDAHITEVLVEYKGDRRLSNGPSTSNAFRSWWRPRTIRTQTRATHFLGDIVLGSVMMMDWIKCI